MRLIIVRVLDDNLSEVTQSLPDLPDTVFYVTNKDFNFKEYPQEDLESLHSLIHSIIDVDLYSKKLG